jgi:rod shape determining protein RodA
MKFTSYLKQFDWFLFLAAILLASIGIAAILSTTWGGQDSMKILDKQIIAAVAGIFFVFGLTFLSYQVLKSYAYVLYAVMISSLVAVLLFGKEIRGTKGWFDLGFFQFQPTEFAKIALLIILAKYFSSISGKSSQIQHILVSSALALIPVGLVLLQPDLGSALILIFLWFLMLLLSGIKKKYVVTLVFLGVSLFWFSWNFALATYQKDRILSFINPMRDPLGAGYHMIQSKIAIGSGELIGRGLGHGPQSQLKFLPDQHTDFIFAVISEELGFLGAGLLLLLLLFLLLRIVKISKKVKDEFGLMVVVGTCFLFLVQMLINIGMNVGVLPVVGVPLPFVSYGGSALLFSFIILGILESITVRKAV